MIFTRMGSRFLFLRSGQHEQLEEYLVRSLSGYRTNLEDAFEGSGENTTIVFITPPGLEKTMTKDALSIILLNDVCPNVLTSLINDRAVDMIDRVHLGPALLFMKIPEGGGKIIQRISEEYNAGIHSLSKAIDEGEAADTILAFTSRSLNRPVPTHDMFSTYLLINRPLMEIQRNIRRDAVRYITEGLKDTHWYEMRINIYDGDNHYMKHVERLTLVFSDLEAGLILGETWTRDQAMMLFSVVAYQIRLFTLLPPDEIKKILVGLEYNKNGKRFVDMDLYYRNKKVEFASLDKDIKKEGKIKTGISMRKEIFSRLSQDTLEKVIKIEEEIRLANMAEQDRKTR